MKVVTSEGRYWRSFQFYGDDLIAVGQTGGASFRAANQTTYGGTAARLYPDETQVDADADVTSTDKSPTD